jgi:hypothetical protein
VARVWSVYDGNYRLVVALSDEPGSFNFTRLPEDDVEPVACEFATLQCYDTAAEPQILNLLFRSRDIDEFLDRLRDHDFKVIDGRPQISKLARL